MKYLLTLACALIISSCSKDNSGTYGTAFEITSCQKIDRGSSGFAKIKLTVRNNSSMTFGCHAFIKIKKGNTIIETDGAVFSSLNPGESQIEESWFSKFDSHSEYDRAEITLSWTIDSTGYSRVYSY